MKRNSTYKDVYDPNSSVKVTVTNKPTIDEETNSTTYEQTVTIKVKVANYAPDKLIFDDDDSIAKFIEDVDFEPEEDLQTSLIDEEN